MCSEVSLNSQGESVESVLKLLSCCVKVCSQHVVNGTDLNKSTQFYQALSGEAHSPGQPTSHRLTADIAN